MPSRFRSTTPDPAWFLRSDGEDGSRCIGSIPAVLEIHLNTAREAISKL